jgi:hypothetical protein
MWDHVVPQMRLSVIEQLSHQMALSAGGAGGDAALPEIQHCRFAVRGGVSPG